MFSGAPRIEPDVSTQTRIGPRTRGAGSSGIAGERCAPRGSGTVSSSTASLS